MSPISNRRRILTIGATYDIGGDLNPNVTTKVQTGDIFNTVAMDMGNRLGLKLPQQVAVGIYYNTPKIAVGADYVYQDWRSGNLGWSRNPQPVSMWLTGTRIRLNSGSNTPPIKRMYAAH